MELFYETKGRLFMKLYFADFFSNNYYSNSSKIMQWTILKMRTKEIKDIKISFIKFYVNNFVVATYNRRSSHANIVSMLTQSS